MIAAILGSALGAFAFAFLIRAPYRETPFGALAGALSGGAYWLSLQLGAGSILAVFIAALTLACGSELLARLRRMPATVFLTPGLIPLVPGLLAYHAMYDFVRGSVLAGTELAIETLLWAGAIGVGIALVVTVMRTAAPPPGKEFEPQPENICVPQREGGRPPKGQRR